MALPKRRHSKTRKNKRRTHDRLKGNSMSVCPECKSPKLPHRVCLVCGHYKGTKHIEFEDEKKQKEKKK